MYIQLTRMRLSSLLPWLIVVALQCCCCSGSNILALFPHIGYSHFKVFHPLLQGLAQRGHRVTVVTYTTNPEPHPNYEELLLEGGSTVNVLSLEFFSPIRSLSVILNEYFILHSEGQNSCEIFYRSGYVEEILERHKRQPYDMVITEFFNTDCYMGVPYVLNVPVVGLSSCALMPWYYDRVVLPDIPSYIQSEFVGFPEELNWQDRLLNFVQARANKLLYRYRTNYYDNKLIKKYLKVDIDVDDFAKRSTSMIFVNQHYSLSGNRPRPTQVIEMGGIHVDERRINDTLPHAISQFLQKVNSNQNVLFISWGSMLRGSSIDKAKLNAILHVTQKLKVKVIWKWESDEKPILSDQFLFVKWAPQLTLLCHPKIKLFWSHAGLLGTTEAVYCAKPLILTPVYGDQFTNANAVLNRKVGAIMHYNDITEEKLEKVLLEVFKKSYAENAIALSNIFRDRERTPLETTIWWVEHLLRNGNTVSGLLHMKAVDLSWFVYHSLDSVAILLVGTIVAILMLRVAIRLMFLMCERNITSKVKTH